MREFTKKTEKQRTTAKKIPVLRLGCSYEGKEAHAYGKKKIEMAQPHQRLTLNQHSTSQFGFAKKQEERGGEDMTNTTMTEGKT